MSGKTEIKKDIEWLNNEVEKRIKKIRTDEVSFAGSDLFDEGYIHGMKDVQAIASQLDEPETISQEWIDEKSLPIIHQAREKDVVPVKDLKDKLVPKREKTRMTKQEMIKEYGMPQSDWSELIERYKWHLEQEGYVVIEKPTIPEFVAEFLDGKEEYALYELLDNDFIYENHDELARWLYNNDEDTNKEREFSLVLAQRYGYEVEEEPKYNVEIKSSFGTIGIFLFKQGDEVLSGDNFKAYCPKEDEFRLTEQEIRGFQNGDVLFEHFAVKVEELEE